MKTTSKLFKDKVAGAVEAPIHPDQREIELKVLATLATVIEIIISGWR